jgi:hypothetical protein
LVAIALGALAEVALRVFYAEQLRKWVEPDIYQNDPIFGYRYIPNAVSRISVPSITKDVHINANGYHGPSFERAAAPGVYRIAVVDASVGTGIWLNGDRTYSVVLQEAFRRAGKRVEVMNFSVDGKSRGLAMLRLIEAEVLDYAPNLVLLSPEIPIPRYVGHRHYYRGYVLGTGHSGASGATLDQNRRDMCKFIDELEDSAWTVLLDASYIVRAFCRFYEPDDKSSPHSSSLGNKTFAYRTKRLQVIMPFEWFSVRESIGMLQHLAKAVEARNSKLVLFTPSALAIPADALAAANLPALILGINFGPELRHRHDSHPNQAGHDLIAARLFEQLEGSWTRDLPIENGK